MALGIYYGNYVGSQLYTAAISQSYRWYSGVESGMYEHHYWISWLLIFKLTNLLIAS
jgi:hypothetical protein